MLANPASLSEPIIGVTIKHGDADWVARSARNYLDALAACNGIGVVLSPDAPVVFPDGATFYPDGEGRLPEAVLAHLDGLVLAGGGDVDPKYFGQPMNGANPASISLLRDELELTLARQAMAANLPVFGICRGCQVLNVAAGGGMVQHFDGHRSSKENPIYHDVLIDPASRLYGIVGQVRLSTNTYHHQGVDAQTLAPLFTSTAVVACEPWLIEAFESQSHAWVVGVQWHPERLYELSDQHQLLWADFVAACRQHAGLHSGGLR